MSTIITFIISLVLIAGFLPQPVNAVYYDKAGYPVPILSIYEKQPPNYSSEAIKPPNRGNQPPNYPPSGAIKTSNRKNQTEQFDYIINNECSSSAVNLYLGETLYSCPNGIKFWSKINIDSSLVNLKTKNRSEAINEESFDTATIVSSTMVR